MKKYYPANKPPAPTESGEQRALFEWAGIQGGVYPELRLMYHIPNEGKRSLAMGARMKAEGLRKGVPDIHLPVARNGYHGLFIEMKRKGGRPEEEQIAWLNELRKNGHVAEVCYGTDDAIQVIIRYLREADQ